MVEAYDVAFRGKFGNEIRAHWGQLMREPTPEEIHDMYPQYDRWRAIRDEFDPQGCFLSEWQNKILPSSQF
jgi:FAD/FMN-containing dehydrogenase